MSDNRTKNTTRNIYSGLIYRVVLILLPFLNRTILLTVLGAEYTGLSSLFTSILGVLNLAELGFNTSVVYSMYKPMATKEWGEVRYYLTLIKKVYSIIGVIVFCGGFSLMPFLKYLISGDCPSDINVYVLYLLYLLNSAISYFLFAYKESLLLADQRSDITSKIRTLVDTSRYLIQFAVIFLTRSFYIYVLIQICGTIISNFLINYCTKKRYPDVLCLKDQKLKIPSKMKQQTAALMVGKVCDTFRNSFDSIIIASSLGLVMTTIYGNYYYIYSAVYGVLLVVGNALAGSVGNSISCDSVEKNYSDLRKFQFLFAGLNIICTTCMVVMYQPFMEIWVGKDLMLSDGNMFLFCLYFYLINMNSIRNQYIDGSGIWHELKISYILEAFGNLALNICLGKMFGISGILWATILTIFIFNYSVRTHKLFVGYFQGHGEARFNLEQLQYAAVALVSASGTFWICSKLPLHGILKLLFCGVCAVAIASLLFVICFIKTRRFKDAKGIVNQIINIILRRRIEKK